MGGRKCQISIVEMRLTFLQIFLHVGYYGYTVYEGEDHFNLYPILTNGGKFLLEDNNIYFSMEWNEQMHLRLGKKRLTSFFTVSSPHRLHFIYYPSFWKPHIGKRLVFL